MVLQFQYFSVYDTIYIMKLRTKALAAVLCCAVRLGFAAENSSYSLPSLLSGYLSNDAELKKLALDIQKASLSSKITEINNGFSVTLATGTMTFSSENNKLSYSVSPSVKATLPQANNLSFSASSDISLSALEKTMHNTALNLSADIVSPEKTKRKVTLLQSNHELLNARRKFQQRTLAVEKAFYSELKLLYENAQSIFSAKNTLYDDTIKFEQTKAQGFLSSSSTYKLIEMKVKSDERSVASATRVFIHNKAVFYKKCGVANLEDTTTPLNCIPAVDVAASPIKIKTFPVESYKTIADAVWAHEINSQSRSAPEFGLSANGGYTFKNTRTDSDSVDAGLSADLSGLKLSTGVSVPVNSKKAKPAVTLSATASPNTRRVSKLEKKQDAIADEQERIAIASAYEAYEESCVECDENLDDLLWQRSTNKENYDMYDALEKDLLKWYQEGYIKRSEYLSAKNNRDLYKVKCIISDIELIIYNDTVKALFYHDDELN